MIQRSRRTNYFNSITVMDHLNGIIGLPSLLMHVRIRFHWHVPNSSPPFLYFEVNLSHSYCFGNFSFYIDVAFNTFIGTGFKFSSQLIIWSEQGRVRLFNYFPNIFRTLENPNPPTTTTANSGRWCRQFLGQKTRSMELSWTELRSNHPWRVLISPTSIQMSDIKILIVPLFA